MFYGVYLPIAGHSLECLAAAISEPQTGARHQILDCSGNQYLASTCERRDARANVNGYAANVVTHNLAFAGMQSGANINSERVYFFYNRAGAADAARRAVKCGEYSVSGRFNLSASQPSKVTSDGHMMIVKQFPPATIPERSSLLS
jgi:hypothetical protein